MFAVLSLAWGIAFSLAGCTSRGSGSTPALNQPYFTFPTEELRSFTIARAYPGEVAWAITIDRTATGAWEITSAPASLSPRRADQKFVEHFLDTLRTFRPLREAPHGSADSLGLDPARFAIRFRIRDNPFELRLGDSLRSASSEETGRFAVFAPGQAAVVGEGALLKMLDYVPSWSGFRQKTLTTREPDDFDLIRVESAGAKAPLRLERAGTDWVTLPAKKKFPDGGARIAAILHLRIDTFVDSAEEQARLDARARTKGAILQHWTLEGRGRTLETWEMMADDGHLYARNSALGGATASADTGSVAETPGAWVEIGPDFLRIARLIGL